MTTRGKCGIGRMRSFDAMRVPDSGLSRFGTRLRVPCGPLPPIASVGCACVRVAYRAGTPYRLVTTVLVPRQTSHQAWNIRQTMPLDRICHMREHKQCGWECCGASLLTGSRLQAAADHLSRPQTRRTLRRGRSCPLVSGHESCSAALCPTRMQAGCRSVGS